MAYDTKRLKTFKWLEGLATNKARYSKGAWNQIPYILTLYGRVYATNGIILASVEYPEFEHISDNGWMIVSEFCGEDGYLLKCPILEEPETIRRERFFEDYFIKQNHFNNEFSFDPAVMKDAMYLFSLYGISCHMAMDGYKLEFSGHNKDVSIRVVMMGEEMSEYIVDVTASSDEVLRETTRNLTEIVRCRDCVYNAKDTDGICYRFCHEHFNQPDGFCAWAERKEGGE